MSAIRLPSPIPKRNVARISVKEYKVVPIGNIRTLVHSISLASEAIPEYMNIKRRRNDNLRSGMASPSVSFVRLKFRMFVDDLSIERFRRGTQRKNTKPFIIMAVKLVPFMPKKLIANI